MSAISAYASSSSSFASRQRFAKIQIYLVYAINNNIICIPTETAARIHGLCINTSLNMYVVYR